MTKRTPIITGLTILILLVVGNFIATRHFFRLDLTDNKQYTLADATKHLLKTLDDAVTIRVYFTKELPPQLIPMKRGIEDLLAEYHQYGGENFQVEFHDPQADPKTERELMMLGIQPMQVNVVEKDKQEVARIFLGLVMLYGDKKEMIPVNPRQPTAHLEEYMSGAIVKLTRDALPVVGWWAPQGAADGEGFALVRQLLTQRFDVRDVSTDGLDLDPATYETVVILSPENVALAAQQQLDRYLDHGGKVVLLVDTVSVTAGFSGEAREVGLAPLLKAYGLRVAQRLVADAVSDYASFRSGSFSYTVPYPFWPSARGEGLNREDPTVSKLETITLPWVSPIVADAQMPDGLTLTKLVESSPLVGETPGEPPFTLDPQSSTLLIPRSETRRRTLAVRVEGKFPNPFGEGGIVLPKDLKSIERRGADGRLIVVGTAAFLQDRFVGQPNFRPGVAFFDNVVDLMTLGDALVGIRSRPVTSRPLPILTAGQKSALRYSHMLGIPTLIILGGFVGVWARRKEWEGIKREYS
jgi:ABC-2 type transport system permease protein